MKRIAIVTFCHRDLLVNYGQVFQAFALQKILEKQDFYVLTISHKRRKLKVKENYINEQTSPSLCGMMSKCFAKTTAFVEKNMKCVQTYGENDICRETADADILICGSDAIWRTEHFDPAFYLDIKGTEGKLKISYAPSFVRFTEEDMDVLKVMGEKIQRIDYISTRESQGAELLANVCGIEDVKVVLDPTLLWKASDWRQYMSVCISKPSGRYIVLYLLDDTNEYDDLIEEILEKHGAESAVTIYTGTTLNNRLYIESGLGPEDFLALFEGAEAVLTNSYHGVAFSLIYHKTFYVCKRQNSFVENDLRFENLCEICNIHDRWVGQKSEIRERSEINWEYIERQLDVWRHNSMAFLNDALNDSKNKKG
ncbi:MAG: polysaccharide pyruvyl transferase family protein [Lachnospiraceae bacterium]|nr:polysaccharide pyruvyl transferase family protein [Lachnospiraceae bacterium]